jgi:hypothetical protein
MFYPIVMNSFLLSVLLLSGAAFIHGRSVAPELRIANATADETWKLLGKAALLAWFGMLAWGVLHKGVWLTLAALVGSLALNALIARQGPISAWPGLSMVFAVTGLGLAAATVLGRI